MCIRDRLKEDPSITAPPPKTHAPEKRKLSAAQQMVEELERQKEKRSRSSNWIVEGIQVKVMNKALLDGTVYKKKGVITKVESSTVAIVKIKETGTKLRIDQQQLETVIPNPGGEVLVVNGAYRGCEAVVKKLEIDSFKVLIEVTQGVYKAKQISVDYEDVSKLA
eukprot:TRINITY_DN19588_c0_g1_i1.p1 TRINITY_DN19588_c0_g1~~TRINITY_DN19588_c0_g1_i1.p1  ORF type:complete len:165 (+),score=66.44 TRINITY_DN19588_c0_g1_i1:155-649(+)